MREGQLTAHRCQRPSETNESAHLLELSLVVEARKVPALRPEADDSLQD